MKIGALAVSVLVMLTLGLSACFQDATDHPPCLPLAIYEDSLRQTTLEEAELPFATVDSIQAAQLLPTITKSVDLRGINGTVIDAIAAISSIEQIRFVACPGIFSGDMLKLAAMPNLRVLDLAGCEVTDTFLANLTGASALRDLRLASEPGLTTTGMTSLGTMVNLRRLKLADCDVVDAWLQQIANITALEYLDLSSNPALTQTGVSHLRQLPNLRELSLANCGLNNAALGEVALCPALVWLDLSGNAGLTQQGIDGLRVSTTLRTLIVRGCDANSAWLGTLGLFTSLEELSLDGSFADTFFSGLAGMTALRRLSLSGTSITSPAMLHVAALTGLEQLDLTGTSVSDAGFGHLQNMPALKRLIADSAGPVGSVGAANISRMPVLESLVLGGASAGIGSSGIASLSLAPSIRSLSLRASGLDDDNLRLLRRLTNLRVLELRNEGGLNGSFISSLVTSGTCLERLTLNGTAIADANYRYVAQLRNLRRLELVNAGSLSKLTFDRIATCGLLERLTIFGATAGSTADLDQGVRNLKLITTLNRLNLRGTVTTRTAAIDHLRVQVPALPIQYGS